MLRYTTRLAFNLTDEDELVAKVLSDHHVVGSFFGVDCWDLSIIGYLDANVSSKDFRKLSGRSRNNRRACWRRSAITIGCAGEDE